MPWRMRRVFVDDFHWGCQKRTNCLSKGWENLSSEGNLDYYPLSIDGGISPSLSPLCEAPATSIVSDNSAGELVIMGEPDC
ncbi:hypothetical protein I7I50_06223 [Histoplasma capsulatum G186AR]|uniref:Uncharacterized protein n=1 Tax=Ajellomyces capsulatus TaxID=5037 RepID=A0A8H7YZU9_AJECA|nr:hypothetical protein I7I52_10704 [Histoplasma capsulatum]QSS67210.1 hypothetical protein I7I50_06223 [Histoplasma capsulatum G186AR]